MSVPLIKLGYLAVRTLSKPIARIVQYQAAEHPWFRSICIRMSQAYHRMEVRLRSRNELDIRPLSDEKAIQLGGFDLFRDYFRLANFIGEFVVFSIAGTVLVCESIRSNRSERNKKARLEARIKTLEEKMLALKIPQTDGRYAQ